MWDFKILVSKLIFEFFSTLFFSYHQRGQKKPFRKQFFPEQKYPRKCLKKRWSTKFRSIWEDIYIYILQICFYCVYPARGELQLFNVVRTLVSTTLRCWFFISAFANFNSRAKNVRGRYIITTDAPFKTVGLQGAVNLFIYLNRIKGLSNKFLFVIDKIFSLRFKAAFHWIQINIFIVVNEYSVDSMKKHSMFSFNGIY